jgi:mRNA interferase MazF
MLMAITSQLRPTPALGKVWLRHWQGAGLLKPSAVKPVIATLEQGLVIRQLGVLDAEDQAARRADGILLNSETALPTHSETN